MPQQTLTRSISNCFPFDKAIVNVFTSLLSISREHPTIVPIVPLTSLNVTSIFLRSITFAPILTIISFGSPPVFVLSSSSVPIAFSTFFFKYGGQSRVSCASNEIFSEDMRSNIVLLRTLHKLHVGNKHTVSHGNFAQYNYIILLI